MKTVFTLLFIFPLMCFGQSGQAAKPKLKPGSKSASSAKPEDGFIINAEIKGFPEETKVALLNGQTGAVENETKIVGNKFSFTGKQPLPDFKIILFNNQPPYITLFLDNSLIKIKGTKDNIDKAVVTGSKSNADFETFNKMLDPYKSVFDENAPYDSAAVSKAILLCGEFAMHHPDSYITPLAIARFNQIADDPAKTEILFNSLSAVVRSSSLGKYLEQVIADNKRNAIGTMLPDFTQNDTSGRPVSLSSFRGKYVLVDFWASWCNPCRQENPNVLDAYNKFKNKNFTVLGVSLDKAKPAWVDAINMDNLAWTHVSDLLGWSNAVALQNQIFSIPQNFLVDPDGKIVAKNLRGPALQRKLSRILH